MNGLLITPLELQFARTTETKRDFARNARSNRSISVKTLAGQTQQLERVDSCSASVRVYIGSQWNAQCRQSCGKTWKNVLEYAPDHTDSHVLALSAFEESPSPEKARALRLHRRHVLHLGFQRGDQSKGKINDTLSRTGFAKKIPRIGIFYRGGVLYRVVLRASPRGRLLRSGSSRCIYVVITITKLYCYISYIFCI